MKETFCISVDIIYFSAVPALKAFADFFAKTDICIVERIKSDRCCFCNIYVSIFIQNALIHADIYDLTDQPAGVFIIAFQLHSIQIGSSLIIGASTFSDFSAVKSGLLQIYSGSLFVNNSYIVARLSYAPHLPYLL